jgi:uncharacterized protein involved in exopolysaccharide biosynthesis
MSDPQQQAGEVDLVTIFGILFRYRWLIIGITAAAAIGTVIFLVISILLPPERSPLPTRYEPEALVLIHDDAAGGGIGAALAQTGLAGLAGLSVPSGSGYGELAVRLLQGNTIVDVIVNEFDFIRRYEIRRFIKDNARKAIHERTTVRYDQVTRTVSIKYEDYDPQLATKVVNRMVELLDQRFSTIGGSRESRKRDMLQEKLANIEREIIRLEEDIQAFQRRYGTIDPQSYAQEHITVMAEMRARLISKQIEVETYAQFARMQDPVASRLRAERDQLEQAIADMELRFYGGAGSSNGTTAKGGEIPQLAVEFGRLERELRVQGKIYEVLTQQYEVARLAAEGEEPIFQVLEVADVPVLKSGPARLIIAVITTFSGFFLSVVLVFIRNAIQNISNDPHAIRRFRGRA